MPRTSTDRSGAQRKICRLAVKLTPKGGRDAVEGWMTDAQGAKLLKARVRAAPENGKANLALVELLADTLGVAKSAVRIVSGATARRKIVEIEGDVAQRLEALGTVT